jgi:hypothetical protein
MASYLAGCVAFCDATLGDPNCIQDRGKRVYNGEMGKSHPEKVMHAGTWLNLFDKVHQ